MSEKKPKPIFISYARKTAAVAATRLRDAFGEDNVFLDTADIQFGEKFPSKIGNAVLDARVVVIFADARYFESPYCLVEMRLAMCTGEREEYSHIAVALADGAGPDVPSLLPSALAERNLPLFSQLGALCQWIEQQLTAFPNSIRERDPVRAQRAFDEAMEGMSIPLPGQISAIPHFGLGGIPVTIGDRFVGRGDKLWELHRALMKRPAASAGLSGLVQGAAGFGKTRMAIEYLHCFGPLHFKGGVFWLNAEAERSLQFRGMLRKLDPSSADLGELEEGEGVAAAFTAALEKVPASSRILFVADNIPENTKVPLDDWCPARSRVTLLTTSRTSLQSVDARIAVEQLAPAAAVRLLTQGLPQESAPTVQAERDWSEICEWVGHHSLALDILNAALREGVVTRSELLDLARTASPVGEVDARREALRDSLPDFALKGVTESLNVSYAALPEPAQRAAKLLARLAPEPIPVILLKALVPPAELARVRGVLRARNWASADPKGGDQIYGRMHRLLADYLNAARDALEVGRRILGAEHLDTLRSMNNLALTLRMQGDLTGARILQEATLEIRRRVLGPEHPDTVASMGNLASTLQAEGDLAGARKLQEQALELRRRSVGAEHMDTLTLMNNLAGTFLAQGDLVNARRLQEETLEVRRRVLGLEHPNTLTSMNNLASTLSAQGDLGRALQLQKEALERRRRVMGAEHPDTLTSMNNLALILHAQADLAGAQKLQEETLDIQRRVKGAKHPHTSASAWNLINTLDHLGECDAANRLLKSDLLWLLDSDPTTLSADQRKIQGWLRERADSAAG